MTRDPSLRSLLASLLVVGWDAPELTPAMEGLLDQGLGGVILHSRNVRSAGQLRRTLATMREHQGDLVVGVDQEGGRISHLTRAECPESPGAAALGVVDDVRMTRDCARELAAHLAGLGIDASYSPVVDVQSDPENPIIRTRSFGADPALVSRHAVAWIEGTQECGVAACAKHFPGHGATAVDSHLGDAVDQRGWKQIEKIDLAPFRAAIDAGVAQIMTSHVRFPSLDDKPTTLSRRLVTDIARTGLGFTGVIISDALEMAAIASRVGVPEGAAQALAAGVDQLCIAEPDPALHDRVLDRLEEAVGSGELHVDALEASSERVRAMHRAARSIRETASEARPSTSRVSWGAAGMDAARRAVDSTDVLSTLTRPVVIDLYRRPKAALEWDGWGLATLVTERCDGADGLSSTNDDLDIERALALAEDRSLVLALQDPAVNPWQQRIADELRRRRPDLIPVSTGLADPGAHLCTQGRGSANLIAAAEAIARACDSSASNLMR
ncbi:beta-N-acetylhexosaminidase [Brachybacterium sp. MASK1Z-5]|uniref:Beta-N-acetylhexosaminidase n=1 Tax=Brachybacterium halotolerans TaxID=2795215 RepID=A0ABS1BAE8_9MICO|nr:beta-N-acetylhexosaminidase [Brachybacterium halotolerans]MBK0331605.1 beta-N-acetylhexosaminidase [Brachybacterium halotolerans]